MKILQRSKTELIQKKGFTNKKVMLYNTVKLYYYISKFWIKTGTYSNKIINLRIKIS